MSSCGLFDLTGMVSSRVGEGMCVILFDVVWFDFCFLRRPLPAREAPPRRPLVGVVAVVGESEGTSSKGGMAFAGEVEACWTARLGMVVGVWLVDRRGRLGVDGGDDW